MPLLWASPVQREGEGCCFPGPCHARMTALRYCIRDVQRPYQPSQLPSDLTEALYSHLDSNKVQGLENTVEREVIKSCAATCENVCSNPVQILTSPPPGDKVQCEVQLAKSFESYVH